MQSKELDPRIVQIGIEYNGQLKLYSDLAIYATGTKYANANQNECEVKIFNLNKDTQNSIVTQATPFNLNRTRKQLVVNAGRKSYGASRIFSGNIISAIPSDRPDISVTIRALTGNFAKGTIISGTQSGLAQFSQIAASVAQSLGLPLNFQAQDKQVGNWNFSGAATKQVDNLGKIGNVNAFIDDDTLVVKEALLPLTGRTRILNVTSGMVGDPKPTEFGIQVKFLLDNQTKLGGGLDLRSEAYPILNGTYIIYKLSFDIATRDTPFYWIAEARRR